MDVHKHGHLEGNKTLKLSQYWTTHA